MFVMINFNLQSNEIKHNWVQSGGCNVYIIFIIILSGFWNSKVSNSIMYVCNYSKSK
jgi:hypothetical protein